MTGPCCSVMSGEAVKKKVRDEVGYRDAYAPKNLFFLSNGDTAKERLCFVETFLSM